MPNGRSKWEWQIRKDVKRKHGIMRVEIKEEEIDDEGVCEIKDK